MAGNELAKHLSEGKPQVQDIDPLFLIEMGRVMTAGLNKYPNDDDGMPNWWKGGDYRSFVASSLRHLLMFAGGHEVDDEDGIPHLAHLAVDAMFLWSWYNRGVGRDTRIKGHVDEFKTVIEAMDAGFQAAGIGLSDDRCHPLNGVHNGDPDASNGRCYCGAYEIEVEIVPAEETIKPAPVPALSWEHGPNPSVQTVAERVAEREMTVASDD